MIRLNHWLYKVTGYPKNPPLWAVMLVCAEDDYGDLWLPSRKCKGYWDRPLNLRRPTHWAPYLLSRITGWIVVVEARS